MLLEKTEIAAEIDARRYKYEKALREIAVWSQELEEQGCYLMRWRRCVAIAREALDER